MKAIPNQVLIFPEQNPFPTYDNSKHMDIVGRAPKFLRTDLIQFQWRCGESENNLICPLIEPYLLFDLLTNGQFSDGLNNWLHTFGYSVVAEQLVHTGSVSVVEQMIGSLVEGDRYTLTINVVSLGGGASITPFLGGQIPANEGPTITTVGTHIIPLTCVDLTFAALSFAMTNDVVIESISLAHVVENNACFSFPNWSYEEGRVAHIQGFTDPLELNPLGSPIIDSGKRYRVKVMCSEIGEGYALLKNGSVVLANLVQGLNTYYFVATTQFLTIEPSSDFDGAIIGNIDIREIQMFPDESVYVIGDNLDGDIVNLVPFITYQKEWATLSFRADNPELSIPMPNFCGYQIVFVQVSDSSLTEVYKSQHFEIAETIDDCKLVRAWCDCEAYDFNFEIFRLSQWVPIVFGAFDYKKNSDVIYTDSSGTKIRSFADRSKSWEVLLEFSPEAVHDCLSLQLQCDRLQVDNIYYFCEDRDYKPTGEKDAKSMTYRAAFNLQLEKNVIYNRNVGCVQSEFLLKVLHAWDEWTSFKTIDKFLNTSNMAMRIDSIIIDEVEILPSPEYILFAPSDPDYFVSEGVNGNTNKFGVTNFIQNADEWVNSFIPDEDVQFYDGLSVVNHRKGVNFSVEITIGLDSNLGANFLRKKWTQDGMYIFPYDPSPVIPYVQ